MNSFVRPVRYCSWTVLTNKISLFLFLFLAQPATTYHNCRSSFGISVPPTIHRTKYPISHVSLSSNKSLNSLPSPIRIKLTASPLLFHNARGDCRGSCRWNCGREDV